MNVGTGTTCKPLSAWVEAPFSKAGWGSSLKGARWAGSLGPAGAPLTVPAQRQVPWRLKAGVSARTIHTAGVADGFGWRHGVFPLKDGSGPGRTLQAGLLYPRASCLSSSHSSEPSTPGAAPHPCLPLSRNGKGHTVLPPSTLPPTGAPQRPYTPAPLLELGRPRPQTPSPLGRGSHTVLGARWAAQ